jgi:hypothetical protein
MLTPKEQNNPVPSVEYQRAQQFINQSIEAMDEEMHIEYRSTIERNVPQSRLR